MENVVKALVPVAMIVTAVALVVKANREASKNKEMIRQCDEQSERIRRMFETMGEPKVNQADQVIARTKESSSKISEIISKMCKTSVA